MNERIHAVDMFPLIVLGASSQAASLLALVYVVLCALAIALCAWGQDPAVFYVFVNCSSLGLSAAEVR